MAQQRNGREEMQRNRRSLTTWSMALALTLGTLMAAGQLRAADKPEVAPYGFVLVNAGYNTDDANPVDIPVTAGGDDEKTFLVTPRQTRFGLKMGGTEALGAKVAGIVEMDFFGLTGSGAAGGVTQSALRLRRAFVKLDWVNTSVLVGQEWVCFAPLSPNTLAHVAIPGVSGSGNLWNRLPQVSLERRMGKAKVNVGLVRPLAADLPVDQLRTQTDVAGAGEKKGLPFFQGRVGISPSSLVTVGASVHFGKLEVADDNDQTFAAAVDLAVQSGALGVQAEGFTGEGTGMLFSQAGRGVATQGGWAQASYKIDKTTCSAGFGLETLDEDDVAAGALSQNQTLFANAVHAAGTNVNLGVEAGYITTSFKGGDDQTNLNINLALQYVF
ncbi:MAG: hypothetical protein AB1505_01450 [Candidatus Latescibacterota bacterium]